MKPPQRPCLKCGETHWGDCAPSSRKATPDNAASPQVVKATKAKPKRSAVSHDAGDPIRHLTNPTAAGALPKFDKKAYQREYMRKRRAKE